MDKNELRYLIALKEVTGVGDVLARHLIQEVGSAQEVFQLSVGRLLKIPKITEKVAKEINTFQAFDNFDREVEWCEKHAVNIIPFYSDKYPKRLLECHDAPLLLFTKGNIDLNPKRIISIVGTRKNTDQGKWITESIVESLKNFDVTIVSGLALGIDGIAHRSALHHNMPTIAVLGHALNQIYPREHKVMAQQMLEDGGWVTEYNRTSKFDRTNFPMRNRIVAGLSDATILIESGASGGSMITAEMAHAYGRELMAVPGRWNDEYSRGPLKLIKHVKAQILTNPEDVAEYLGWKIKEQLLIDDMYDRKIKYQNLEPLEMKLVSFLGNKDPYSIDSIHYGTDIPMNILSSTLLSLEFKGLIHPLPGKRFQLK